MNRLRLSLIFTKRLGAFTDGPTHRGKGVCQILPVLRGKLVNLLVRQLFLDWLLPHKQQLLPQTIQPGRLSVIQHQARQRLVFTMEQDHRHYLIHRHDLCVTHRRGKQFPEIIERALHPAAPGTGLTGHNRLARNQPLQFGSRGGELKLHAACLSLLGMKQSAHRNLSSGRQAGRQAKLQHRRSLGLNIAVCPTSSGKR